MKLLIQLPAFYCHSDEDCFFRWLKSIEGVAEVIGAPEGLIVEFDRLIDRDSFYELVGLLVRYGVQLTSLRAICESHPDPWFRDKSNYWYGGVFHSRHD